MKFTLTEDKTPEENFNFKSPEDVLMEVIEDAVFGRMVWGDTRLSIESCTIINTTEGVIGAASYEEMYGGFLDYTLEDLIEPPGPGWYVVEGVTAIYNRGDGWATDDDMEFDFVALRPATPEEIALV